MHMVSVPIRIVVAFILSLNESYGEGHRGTAVTRDKIAHPQPTYERTNYCSAMLWLRNNRQLRPTRLNNPIEIGRRMACLITNY